ncbi:MAG TPA: murein biosynthesis integral membrane protein MurJ [Kofleriaceae bacterium]|nr:murein biosynthesis integral membrane protein MurJ [Kofleriaceae bacterium]
MAAKGLGRTAGLISLATMLSRVLGLVREQLFAALLGATAMADAFIAAFRIPNLLRDLFAEGALSQAFVPAFKKELRDHGKEGAYKLGNTVAGNLMVVVGLFVGFGVFFAPEILVLMAKKFDEVGGKFALAVELTRIMMPFLLLVTLAAVAMGMLNSQERYGPPALAPAMFNVVTIIIGIGLALAGVEGRHVAVGWAIGTLVAGMAQLGIQLPALWRSGWRPSLRFDLALRDPSVRQVAMVMAPAIVSVAAVQVNVFVNTSFASSEQGAVSWLNYAFRFLQLPIGVFGVAIATVSTTRFADAAVDDDRAALSRHLVEGLRLVAFLCVPATVGLIVLGEPIIRLIYQRGNFHYWDTDATTRALDLYVVGLVAYAAVKVLAPAFYAVKLTRIAVVASISAVAANVILNYFLHPIYGYKILALGTALSAVVNCAILYVGFHRRIAPIPHGALLMYLLRIGVAAAVMGGATWGVAYVMDGQLGHTSFAARCADAMIPVTVGAAVYAIMCAVLRVEELDQFLGKLQRRLKR